MSVPSAGRRWKSRRRTTTSFVADSFGYRILCVNAPVATDANTSLVLTNALQPAARRQPARAAADVSLAATAQRQLGPGRQTFRTMVAGQIVTKTHVNGQILYFYQPQSFVNVTNAP